MRSGSASGLSLLPGITWKTSRIICQHQKCPGHPAVGDARSGTATSNPCHCSCAGGSTTHSYPEAPKLSWFSKGYSAEAVAWWEPTGILFLVGLC